MALRDIAIVGTAQRPSEVNSTFTSVEILLPVIQQLLDKVGIERSEIGFWCHGSCDYMSGQPFSFVAAVDAIGAWPPIIESHVEADGALALYEAWVKIQTGEVDVALVFSNGKQHLGQLTRFSVCKPIRIWLLHSSLDLMHLLRYKLVHASTLVL